MKQPGARKILDKLIGIFRFHCKICNKVETTDNTMDRRYIWEGGMYGHYVGYSYHKSCLKDCMANPEKYGHRAVDMALKITDELLREHREKEKARMELASDRRILSDRKQSVGDLL